jgi:ribosomal protein S18 acetylase RimI-like enzyme
MVTSVRPMGRQDLPAVLAIEAATNPMPWKEADFTAFLPGETDTEAFDWAIRVGAEKWAWVWTDPQVRGFLCAAGMVDEVELQVIAVEPGHWGLGIGSELLQALLGGIRSRAYRIIHLEVREGNAGALALYRKWGFASAGRRPKYYRNPDEDALLLSLTL